MTSYNLQFASDTPIDQVPGMGRSLLQVYTGSRISEMEADRLLRRIADHKWHISEKLNRDVGFHVAAIDYVENFYQPQPVESPLWTFLRNTGEAIKTAFTKYFTARSVALPL
ncbi:MAG: hypothetical protein QM785_17200 [Pyrinomonadaceae bacterium]